MKVQISESGKRLAEGDLTDLENELQAALPSEYRSFLLEPAFYFVADSFGSFLAKLKE
jgi:hypothetical protein